MRIFTDLDLHVRTPLRTQPTLGEWSPQGVVTTKTKKRSRWLWVGAFLLVSSAMIALGYYAYRVVMAFGG